MHAVRGGREKVVGRGKKAFDEGPCSLPFVLGRRPSALHDRFGSTDPTKRSLRQFALQFLPKGPNESKWKKRP